MEINWIGLVSLIRREVHRLFRVMGQTLAAPFVSAVLFLFIFGSVLGQKIELIAGIPYIQFVFPGILMMNVLTAAFMHSSNGLYFARFIKTIEEMLVAPLSYFEMVAGYILGALIRALLIAVAILAVGLIFGAVSGVNIPLFLFYTVTVSVTFALLGLIVGLWAKGFEQLNILNTFLIMPLSFLGGMFYSVDLLPDIVAKITHFNPFFYFIDGIRYSMTGVSESNLTIGVILILSLVLVLGGIVWYLFSKGWRIRD